MHQEKSHYQISRKLFLQTTSFAGLGSCEACEKKDQSLFSHLLEIESRLRREARNDKIEQLKRSKEKDRKCSRINNLSRHCEQFRLVGRD